MLNVACEETDLMEGCQFYCKEPIDMDTASFIIQKLWEAISSPGVGYIGAKMLKANAACPLNHLLNICNQTLDQCKALPYDWRKFSWPKIPKKGDPSFCDNYRVIFFPSVSYKVFCRMLLMRKQEGVETSWTDCWVENTFSFYISFINCKKAFDRVRQKALEHS